MRSKDYKKLFEGKFTKTFIYRMNFLENLYYHFSPATYNERLLFDNIAKYIDPNKKNLILDIGCGGGHFRLARYGEVIGVDISEASLIEAKKIYPQVMEVDVSKKIPFPNKHFDFVFCSEVFGHIEKKDKEKFMRELHRVLKPGGFVFFSIETLGNNKLTSFLKRKKLYKKYWIDYQGHIGLESPRKTLGRFQDKFTILTSRMTSSHILPIDGYLTFREEYKILAIFKNDFIRRSLNILLFPVFYTTIRLSDFDTANDIVIVGQKTPPTSKK